MIVVINLMRPSIITWVSVAFPDAKPKTLPWGLLTLERLWMVRNTSNHIVSQAGGSAQENEFVTSMTVTWKAISHWFLYPVFSWIYIEMHTSWLAGMLMWIWHHVGALIKLRAEGFVMNLNNNGHLSIEERETYLQYNCVRH